MFFKGQKAKAKKTTFFHAFLVIISFVITLSKKFSFVITQKNEGAQNYKCIKKTN